MERWLAVGHNWGMVEYDPDDTGIEVETLRYLRGEEGVRLRGEIGRLKDPGKPTVAEVAGLRKGFPAEAVRVGLILAGLQGKGREKFPGVSYVWGVPEAVEQATSGVVAEYKARRVAGLGVERVFDLCCGIGGDAMALAEVGRVMAVDLSAVRVACLELNLMEMESAGRKPQFGVEMRVEDVRKVIPGIPREAFVHIDPARRVGGKRSARYADLVPGGEVLEGLVGGVACGAMKLSPAVEFDSLKAVLRAGDSLKAGLRTQLEIISQEGVVVQAVLWWGIGAKVPRRATVLKDGAEFSVEGEAAAVSGIPGREELLTRATTYLGEVDGALTRGGLAGVFAEEHGLVPLTVDGGYVGAGELPGKELPIDWFRVERVVPFDERGLERALVGMAPLPGIGQGAVEVKTRGMPQLDTDGLQVRWSKVTGFGWTVLVFRHGQGALAAIGSRVKDH